ncbi:FAD-binding oxidoreductase [Kribbella sp. NPDC051718]|uniref:FAD-binding oxidoreductase n=1 Tax=Kribbella sp. NPDC051718 TaxID=3155168 RepID=UPI003412467E
MIESLREVLTGRVVTPEDLDWESVRTAWNLTVDQRPLAVVEAAGPSDVEHTVAFAAAHGLKVAAQAGGHGATKSLDQTIVVRTNALDDIWVDSHARIARVGAGVRWGALQSALDGTGLTGLLGSTGNVSVVGFCTNGGLSWFSRPYGSGAASLRAAEIVDASGSRRWIDDSTEPDLMWALRGGGGNFAVVTSVEVELFLAPELTGGRLMFPIHQAEAVLTAYKEATESAAGQVTLWAYLTHFPDAPFMPEPIRGQSFCMIDAVTPFDPAALEAALAPIRAAGTAVVDSVGPQTPGSIGEITQEPVEPTSFTIQTATFDELTPELIGVLLKHAGQPSLIFQVQLRHLRASQEVGHEGVAAADPAAKYSFSALAILPVPELEQPATQALLALKDAVAPWHAGDSVPSMLPTEGTLQDVISEPDLARLREIKQRVDPVGLLVGNFPVVH